jgi:DNA-binding NtrC family response regulator
LLAAALLERVAPQRRLAISPAAISLLQAQEFPGNVRELRNLLERAALLCDGDMLESGHVEQALLSGRRPAARAAESSQAPRGLRDIQHTALRERAAQHQGSRAALAAELGISERSLYRKLKAAGAA